MITRLLLVAMSLIIMTAGGCNDMNDGLNLDAERAKITKVLNNSIGWAATKDTVMSYACYAHDPELFWFSPRDDGTLYGFDAFVKLTEGFFMNDDFKAVSYKIRDLQINLSRSGDVAWYHARLDDFNTWKGQPANWEDVRWTGVLEKRDGRWVIVQMHFSRASDKT